ncbi:M48 family metallopeptidase [Ramlibacter sp. MMS24-I3-19]|uniref:M48 family metallopeptidase n=1 Tax=Ramlibacter sp. MMS24-I3-19 TaxID=3416606 RepID=UPI003CFD1F9D
MCQLCVSNQSFWRGRRGFLLAAGAAAATPVLAQVDVGKGSRAAGLVPAEEIEAASAQQYSQLLAEAKSKGALAPENNPSLQKIRAIAQRMIPQGLRFNERARSWRWEVNLIGSKEINAFCMPGGKIAFFTGLLEQLKLTEDEAAMVMGHEMAHALREHARARVAKEEGTNVAIGLVTQLFGLGQLGQMGANLGAQLLTLRWSRADESEADLVGLEIGARAGYNPDAAVSLWTKMEQVAGGSNGPAWLSTHPSGPDRLERLRQNIPKVRGLYEQAIAHR